MILTTLQNLPNNVGNLGKIIVAASFECLPKKQNIAQTGHTDATHLTLLSHIKLLHFIRSTPYLSIVVQNVI